MSWNVCTLGTDADSGPSTAKISKVGISLEDQNSSSIDAAEATLLRRLRAGGPSALADVFSTYQERLHRMVSFRLDPRVRGRIDAADVLQEAYLRISRRLVDFLDQPSVSFFVWVRQQTLQVLIDMQRTQFREARSPQREIRLATPGDSAATSLSIACRLVDAIQSPSQIVSRNEALHRVREALESMNPIDREVLALRHFEQLGNAEVAQILNLSPTAASNRYVRAAGRLADIVSQVRADTSGQPKDAP